MVIDNSDVSIVTLVRWPLIISVSYLSPLSSVRPRNKLLICAKGNDIGTET